MRKKALKNEAPVKHLTMLRTVLMTVSNNSNNLKQFKKKKREFHKVCISCILLICALFYVFVDLIVYTSANAS